MVAQVWKQCWFVSATTHRPCCSVTYDVSKKRRLGGDNKQTTKKKKVELTEVVFGVSDKVHVLRVYVYLEKRKDPIIDDMNIQSTEWWAWITSQQASARKKSSIHLSLFFSRIFGVGVLFLLFTVHVPLTFMARPSCLGRHCSSLTIPCSSLFHKPCLLLWSVLFVFVGGVFIVLVLVLVTPFSISHPSPPFFYSFCLFRMLHSCVCHPTLVFVFFSFIFPSFFASSLILSQFLTAFIRSLSLFPTYPPLSCHFCLFQPSFFAYHKQERNKKSSIALIRTPLCRLSLTPRLLIT